MFIAHNLYVVSLAIFYFVGPLLAYLKGLSVSCSWYTYAKMNFNIIIAKVCNMLLAVFFLHCAASQAANQPFDRSLSVFSLSQSRLYMSFTFWLPVSYEIFHHLLYRTEYFIFKSKFCSNLFCVRAARRAHQLCALPSVELFPNSHMQ